MHLLPVPGGASKHPDYYFSSSGRNKEQAIQSDRVSAFTFLVENIAANIKGTLLIILSLPFLLSLYYLEIKNLNTTYSRSAIISFIK
jgi:hypothetical protein